MIIILSLTSLLVRLSAIFDIVVVILVLMHFYELFLLRQHKPCELNIRLWQLV